MYAFRTLIRLRNTIHFIYFRKAIVNFEDLLEGIAYNYRLQYHKTYNLNWYSENVA